MQYFFYIFFIVQRKKKPSMVVKIIRTKKTETYKKQATSMTQK